MSKKLYVTMLVEFKENPPQPATLNDKLQEFLTREFPGGTEEYDINVSKHPLFKEGD